MAQTRLGVLLRGGEADGAGQPLSRLVKPGRHGARE